MLNAQSYRCLQPIPFHLFRETDYCTFYKALQAGASLYIAKSLRSRNSVPQRLKTVQLERTDRDMERIP